MSRYITEPGLVMTEGFIECRDTLAYRNKRRYGDFEILIDAMICRHTKINVTQDIT
jgi:hypothetical protein